MKVFISWSGDRSKRAAEALRDWLPNVIQNTQPWMSGEDLDAGTRWGKEIDEELESANFGILCITPENAGSPWINYEAGALAKSVTVGRVVPYLIGMTRIAELPSGPLSRFQAKLAASETSDVVTAINKAM